MIRQIRKGFFGMAFLCGCLIVSQTQAAIVPVGVDDTNADTFANASFVATNLIDGDLGTRWVTEAASFPSDYIADNPPSILVFDLGADTNLSQIDVSTYHGGDGSAHNNAVTEFDLSFATEAEGPGGVGTTISDVTGLTVANIGAGYQNNIFGLISARYVQLTITDNAYDSDNPNAGGDRAGMSDVRFAVPEPASAGLLLMGIVGLLGSRRRRSC